MLRRPSARRPGHVQQPYSRASAPIEPKGGVVAAKVAQLFETAKATDSETAGSI